ncbi:MAG: hypothetical protein V4612_05255 [Pseudomonadota bacterium]
MDTFLLDMNVFDAIYDNKNNADLLLALERNSQSLIYFENQFKDEFLHLHTPQNKREFIKSFLYKNNVRSYGAKALSYYDKYLLKIADTLCEHGEIVFVVSDDKGIINECKRVGRNAMNSKIFFEKIQELE